jgi:hypothetical protein
MFVDKPCTKGEVWSDEPQLKASKQKAAPLILNSEYSVVKQQSEELN